MSEKYTVTSNYMCTMNMRKYTVFLLKIFAPRTEYIYSPKNYFRLKYGPNVLTNLNEHESLIGVRMSSKLRIGPTDR